MSVEVMWEHSARRVVLMVRRGSFPRGWRVRIEVGSERVGVRRWGEMQDALSAEVVEPWGVSESV